MYLTCIPLPEKSPASSSLASDTCRIMGMANLFLHALSIMALSIAPKKSAAHARPIGLLKMIPAFSGVISNPTIISFNASLASFSLSTLIMRVRLLENCSSFSRSLKLGKLLITFSDYTGYRYSRIRIDQFA